MNQPNLYINLAYVVSAALFVFGLKMLSSPATARRGNLVSALGMFVAVVFTLGIGGLDFKWIILGVVVGSAIGYVAAMRVEMTAMPEMVALFNGFGGIASLLLAWSEYHQADLVTSFTGLVTYLSAFIGGVTFTGSMVAYGKLSGRLNQKPILFSGQHLLNGGLLALSLLLGLCLTVSPQSSYWALVLVILLALGFGVTSVIPIGGADMPVVISLLNSYSGLAACAAGFVVHNNILIVAGALVGASGIILTNIMCKAMNRSLANVLFSGFGAAAKQQAGGPQGEIKPASAEDVYYLLEAADSVVFVPGYGLAVAQAQHALKELMELLEEKGVEVKFAIHPVAGRMPGHMNVLLAEADIPYDHVFEMDEINPEFATADVALVVGANDVTNPAAKTDPSSPIYGMPILEVGKARHVYVIKRSMRPGYSGVENLLYYQDNCSLIFGDAKDVCEGLVTALKGGGH